MKTKKKGKRTKYNGRKRSKTPSNATSKKRKISSSSTRPKAAKGAKKETPDLEDEKSGPLTRSFAGRAEHANEKDSQDDSHLKPRALMMNESENTGQSQTQAACRTENAQRTGYKSNVTGGKKTNQSNPAARKERTANAPAVRRHLRIQESSEEEDVNLSEISEDEASDDSNENTSNNTNKGKLSKYYIGDLEDSDCDKFENKKPTYHLTPKQKARKKARDEAKSLAKEASELMERSSTRKKKKRIFKSDKKRLYESDSDPFPEEEEELAEDADFLASHLSIGPLCTKCKPSRSMSKKFRNEDNKLFYSCSRCNGFMWPEQALKHLPSGPPCKCSRPSQPLRIADKCFFVCPKTGGGTPCDFELDISKYHPSMTVSSGMKDADAASFDQQFLVGEATRQKLQDLLHVPAEESRDLGKGRDSSAMVPDCYYDYLKVERAWKVECPDEQLRKFEEFRAEQGRRLMGSIRTPLRSEYEEAMLSLCGEDENHLEPLQKDANEVLLIHGTKPEVVASILEKSLDPKMARPGIFGRGTYFAENAAKFDQYATKDVEFCCSRREQKYDTLCKLHNKLYPQPTLHPGNAYYALACRVVLGCPDTTTVTKSRPAEGHHSLVAEVGGDLKRFREFVVFDKSAIKIEYIVCFTRERNYCYCNPPSVVRRRTFWDVTLKTHKPCIACPQSRKVGCRWEGGCGLFSSLPRCFCRRADGKPDFYSARLSKDGYRVECRKSRCSFNRLMEQGVDLREAEDEDQDAYDYEDGFLVKG